MIPDTISRATDASFSQIAKSLGIEFRDADERSLWVCLRLLASS